MALSNIEPPINPTRILDIGANVGGFYHEAHAIWPDAEFHLIEGNPACTPFLSALGVPCTIAYLGDTERTVNFFKRKGGGTDTGNSYYREQTEFFADDQIEIEPVNLCTLDSLNLGTFDLVKLDTQGSELDVVRGGETTIRTAKWVLMEVAYKEYNEGAPMAPEVLSFMAERGFGGWQSIGDIIHPTKRHVIQRDILFTKTA